VTWSDKLAGSTLTAAILNELASYATEVSATKVADTSRNTTISPAADPELSIVLLANRTYEFGLDALIVSAANAAGDFRVRLAWTNTATVTWRCAGHDISLASGVAGTANFQGAAGNTVSPTTDTSFGASTSTNNGHLFGEIVTGVSNVTLTVEWAQVGSNANNTTLRIGSRLWARRVA
jgi:hypothetical protein